MLRNRRKNKDIVIKKSDKGNAVVILDLKISNNAVVEMISHTSKFEKVNEEPAKIFFNESKYNKLYRSDSAPSRIYGTPKMHTFSSVGSFSILCPIVSSIGTSNYNLAHFLCNLLSSLAPNDYSCKDTFSFFFSNQECKSF